MIVAHNIGAMNAQRQLKVNTSSQSKSMEKLSSGYRINRAADDAAGLSISEKMRRQIRGLDRASTNAQDGISMVQIADGALTEVHDMLDRMTELTIQAANGTNSEQDRDDIQQEINQLSKEIDKVQTTTKFNEIGLFPENGHSPDEIGFSSPRVEFNINGRKIELEYLDPGNSTPVSATAIANGAAGNATKDFGDFVVDAAAFAVDKLASLFPNMFSASSDNIKIGLNAANIDGVGGTLAIASMSWSTNFVNSTSMSYTLNIDTSDYPQDGFDKTGLASTIAHEMTHLIMDDTLNAGMLSNFPKWFKEGMAQTASGDGGWVSGQINASSSDDDIKNYMKKGESMPYGAGYMAVMALGLEVSKANGGGTVNSSSIASGLDALIGKMVDQQKAGKPLSADEAIKEATKGKYNSFADYMGAFKRGTGDLLKDVKDILQARGSGAGSLLGALNASTGTIFGASPSGPVGKYTVDYSVTGFKNSFAAGFIYATSLAVGTSIEDGGDVILQVGADAGGGNQMGIMRFNVSADAILGGQEVNVKTQESAVNSIDLVKVANERVSKVRSYYGAIQNRLEHTIKNLDNVVENTTAAESRIRDTDMADEMVLFSKNNILIQAGQSMLTQANQQPQGVLSLLQ